MDKYEPNVDIISIYKNCLWENKILICHILNYFKQ